MCYVAQGWDEMEIKHDQQSSEKINSNWKHTHDDTYLSAQKRLNWLWEWTKSNSDSKSKSDPNIYELNLIRTWEKAELVISHQRRQSAVCYVSYLFFHIPEIGVCYLLLAEELLGFQLLSIIDVVFLKIWCNSLHFSLYCSTLFEPLKLFLANLSHLWTDFFNLSVYI